MTGGELPIAEPCRDETFQTTVEPVPTDSPDDAMTGIMGGPGRRNRSWKIRRHQHHFLLRSPCREHLGDRPRYSLMAISRSDSLLGQRMAHRSHISGTSSTLLRLGQRVIGSRTECTMSGPAIFSIAPRMLRMASRTSPTTFPSGSCSTGPPNSGAARSSSGLCAGCLMAGIGLASHMQ